MTEVLANSRVVFILQYIHASNQHTVHLKLTQCYMSHVNFFKVQKLKKYINYHDLSKRKHNSHNNGIGCTRNNSVSNRDRVNLILGYPSHTTHMLTNLYCRCQLTDKGKN